MALQRSVLRSFHGKEIPDFCFALLLLKGKKRFHEIRSFEDGFVLQQELIDWSSLPSTADPVHTDAYQDREKTKDYYNVFTLSIVPD